MSQVLGIDASTQSCSGIVIDVEAGTVVAEASINFGVSLPAYDSPQGFIPNGEKGEVHASPLMWLDALELLFEELGKSCDLSRVTAISGAGQQHGTVYLNRDWSRTLDTLPGADSLSAHFEPALARATSPIWMDSSTSTECSEISDTVGGAHLVCEKSGSATIERFSGPQIRRFYKTEPEAYDATSRIHLVSSFFCSVLSGVDAPIDTGDGAGMNLLNLQSWEWDPELLEATAPDLLQRLPKVVSGKTTVGVISSYFIRKFGFSEQVPVTVFTGDNPSSLVGMGASSPGKTVISLGTSDTFFAAMPGVVTDPKCQGHAFGNPSGGSMSLQCFVNGSLAREAVKDRFNYNWDAFTQALEATPAGNEGQLMLPFFRPEISPILNLDAPILKGSDAFESGEEPAQMIRACVEGQFLNMRLQTEWMKLEPDVIFLTGGASSNDAIAQVIADIFEVKVERLSVTGAVALGAALRAAQNTLGANLSDLENTFCEVDAQLTILPKAPAGIYEKSLNDLSSLLQTANEVASV
ncbi:MAG: FGGY family carbohydrate kinase [Verrucomicrobiota bacterium]